MENALFGVDHGIFAVGSERERRLLAMLLVVVHAAPAGFLIRAENYPDAAAEGYARLLYRGKRVYRGERGALVVKSSPAVQYAVLYDRAVGRMLPARAFGNDVQMADYAEHLLAFAMLNAADIALHVGRPESQALGCPQRVVQRVGYVLAERRTLDRGSLRAGNANVLLKGRDQLVTVALDYRINDFVHVMYLLLVITCIFQ